MQKKLDSYQISLLFEININQYDKVFVLEIFDYLYFNNFIFFVYIILIVIIFNKVKNLFCKY